MRSQETEGPEELLMSNVIDLSSKRQAKANSIFKVIAYILSQNQATVIGTNSADKMLRELRARFPDAKLEVVEIGIKISNE